jgi:hypothetical protein
LPLRGSMLMPRHRPIDHRTRQQLIATVPSRSRRVHLQPDKTTTGHRAPERPSASERIQSRTCRTCVSAPRAARFTSAAPLGPGGGGHEEGAVFSGPFSRAHAQLSISRLAGPRR